MKKAVVLLSGGIDSATTLFSARAKGYRCLCLIFDYGQRHRKELACARRIARDAGAEYRIVKIRLSWQGSALLDKKIKIPAGTPLDTQKIPATYVPGRNTIFLSFASSCAEAIGAEAVFIGANAVDFSGYPDCRPQYYRVFNRLIRQGTKAGVQGRPLRIETPLLHKTKGQIVKLAQQLGVPLAYTWSCYRGAKAPCGTCDSCRFRAKGFKEAGITDPLLKKP
ncbi:MAG TPA: 7-cyano-7-deazaguanine synthase QueC [Patescibacteria group bacterium]|nr:7-cyano-7-deazaguanine synthase QueC [Patescibacteria group bacterium]